MNFAFILFQAMGAYITAVLTLPKATPGSAETYILGWHLPWPLPCATITFRNCRRKGTP